MIDFLAELRRDEPTLEFHVAGDKFMRPDEDPGYPERLEALLRTTPGVVWHGSLSREATTALVAEGGIALNLWDYRFGPRMNDLVVSTKLLDYAAAGVPIVLTRTPTQAALLGEDYPLFVAEVDDALPLLRRVLADADLYRAAADRAYEASRAYTYPAVHELIAPYLAGHADARRTAAGGVVTRPWLILREGDRRRWGGDLRRHYLLDGLAERTHGHVVEDRRVAGLLPGLQGCPRAALAGVARAPARRLDRDPHRQAVRADREARRAGGRRHPRRHAPPERRPRRRDDRGRRRCGPGAGRAQPGRLPVARRPVGAVRRPSPVSIRRGRSSPRTGPTAQPCGPVRGRTTRRSRSCRAPRRAAGIEDLVEAVRIARRTVPGLRLDLVLAATGDDSRAYLDRLQAGLEGEPWVTIGPTPYPELGARLGRATVLAIPTPAHRYWDSVGPVKVFDYFAAGRPVMTTPRTETARIVREVEARCRDRRRHARRRWPRRSSSCSPHPRRRAASGANARAAAERDYDWRVISRRLADEILARIG